MEPASLLARFLELVDGSADYFVSGSFSFLPLVESYRQPDHDLDVAIAASQFSALANRRAGGEEFRFLRLGEVALANRTTLARVLWPRTAFAHLDTSAGLLDIALYRTTANDLRFSLGAGLALHVPVSVQQRIIELTWKGSSYRAGPVELAFLPKAAAYLADPGGLPRRQLEDLRRLANVVDWAYVGALIRDGGLRWRGRPLPRPLRRLDPFPPGILRLRDTPFLPAA